MQPITHVTVDQIARELQSHLKSVIDEVGVEAKRRIAR
jgi:hypothetical protein